MMYLSRSRGENVLGRRPLVVSAKGTRCALRVRAARRCGSVLGLDVPLALTGENVLGRRPLVVSAKGTRAAKGMREVERWGIGVLEGR